MHAHASLSLLLALALVACGGGGSGEPKSSAGTPAGPGGDDTSTAGGSGATPLPRTSPDWQAYEAPQAWNYQAVYPSRSGCGAGEGTTFDVGPGQPYATLKAVPWLSLLPCDTVNIHYSPTPYRDIIFLGSRGRANKWITIRGVPGPNGELPILDGANAVMPQGTGANSWTDTAGMIIVMAPDGSVVDRSGQYKPGYLHISGLKIRHARPPHQVTNLRGEKVTWGAFSAGIYINGGEQVAITGCELTANGLGLFANSTAGEQFQTRNLLIARNHFHDNSNVGSFSEHNAYTEGIGTVYEYNYFGNILAGSYGDNIKERSAGIVFRYNHIEGGADLIALRDPESNVEHEMIQLDAWGEKLVSAAFIYGNTFVTRDYVQGIIGHGDGSMGTGLQPRDGRLYFYNNRVVSMVDNEGFWRNNTYFETQGVALFDLLNTRSPTTVVALNNLLYATSRTAGATPAPIALFYWQGRAEFDANWTNHFIQVSDPYGGTNLATGSKWDGRNLLTGTQIDGAEANGLTRSSASPGFVDAANGNYLTTASSPYANLQATYPLAITRRGLVPQDDPVTRPLQR